MATSGTHTFNLDVAEIIQEAYERVGFDVKSGYDLDTKELTYTSVNIYRDLHCWEMLFNWIPIGFHKSYTITIRVKADVLKDLKYEKTKNWFTPEY